MYKKLSLPMLTSRILPLLLVLIAPLVAEVVSGATPLSVFFRPPVLITYLGFYGLGALLIREAKARRTLNYLSVLLLGMAFGVLEEGTLLKSWFDPNWMGGAILSQSLRVGNFSPLQLFNSLYHGVFSILTPILLVESFAEQKEKWLSGNQLLIVSVFFVLASLLLGQFNRDYPGSWFGYGFTLAIVFLITAVGLEKFSLPPGKRAVSAAEVWLVNSFSMPLLALALYGTSLAGAHWLVTLILTLGLIGTYSFYYRRLDYSKFTRVPERHVCNGVDEWPMVQGSAPRRNPAKVGATGVNPWGFTDGQLFAMAAGFITSLVIFSLFQVNRSPAKLGNLTVGGIVVALLVVYYLYNRDR